MKEVYMRYFILLLAFFGSFCESKELIVGGRKIYFHCIGEGSPTVVFIAGRTDRADTWNDVIFKVAEFTHACAYDRPGTVAIVKDAVHLSRSDEVNQPTTPLDAVADLHTLLTEGKIPSPYVLVAHSYGGMIARAFANKYPQNVVGLVLVDTLTEHLYDGLDPQEQQLWVRLNSNYSKELDALFKQEKTDLVESFRQMRGIAQVKLPTIILASDKPYDFKELIKEGVLPPDAPLDFGPKVFNAHIKGQERLAAIYGGKLIKNTHAGHYIQNENPKVVIDAIREVVDRSKGQILK